MTVVSRGGRRRGGHAVPGPDVRGRDACVSGWAAVCPTVSRVAVAVVVVLGIAACTSGGESTSAASVGSSAASADVTSGPSAAASPTTSTGPAGSTPSPAASTRMASPAPAVTPGRTPGATPGPDVTSSGGPSGAPSAGSSGGSSDSSTAPGSSSGATASPSAPAPDPSASVPFREVVVTAPEDGATVSLPVVVEVAVTGFDLVDLTGEISQDEGHLWAFVDVEPPVERVRLPESRAIVKSSDRRIEVGELPPGEHTVTVVATHGYPVPFEPRVQDAVTFTVAGS